MKKKTILMVLLSFLLVGVVGCGNQAEEVETVEETAAEEIAAEEIAVEEIADEEMVVEESRTLYESQNGYSVTYMEDYFSLTNSDGVDRFEMKGIDYDTEVPAYVSISVSDEYGAADLVEGLALQSGTDEVQVSDTHIGANSYPVQCVYYSLTDDPRGTSYYTFHVLDMGDSVLLIEGVSGDELSPQEQNAMEELLGTFEMEAKG